jgi:hypothetical protein
MPRSLKGDWITQYIQNIAESTESPLKFHFWCAATAIAATLKRHVWIKQPTFKLYPNLYTVLVGRPAIGKGLAMNPVIDLMKRAGTVNVLSDRITMEYALEKLSKGFPKIHPTGTNPNGSQAIKLGTEATALITSTELSVFLTASQFSITCLTDLWDSKEGIYQYGTRGKGEWNINEPCVSLLGGSAQDYLIKSIPADAIGGGFTRRVNFVFGPQKDKKDKLKEQNKAVQLLLEDDLRQISLIRGEMTYSKEAFKIMEEYRKESEPDEFDYEATASYKD